MKLSPYVMFDGQCETALKFYEKCLGGKTLMSMTYGASPMANQFPAGWGKKIIHATFALGDQTFGASDAVPERYQKPQGFRVTLDIPAPAEAERVFKALSEKGAVEMPLQETFWAERFGMLTDQFAVPWMINCGKQK